MEWVQNCRQLMNALVVVNDESRHSHEALMTQLAKVAESIERVDAIALTSKSKSSPELLIEVPIIRAYLQQNLPQNEGQQGFL